MNTTARDARIRTLNNPQSTTVMTDSRGVPSAVIVRRRRNRVIGLIDRWLLEEGWWREYPTRRIYFRVQMENGRDLVVYQDLETRQWLLQRG